jgi:hypothetical protein
MPPLSLSQTSDDADSAETSPVYRHNVTTVSARRFVQGCNARLPPPDPPRLSLSAAIVTEASAAPRLALSPPVTPPQIVPLALPPDPLSLSLWLESSDDDSKSVIVETEDAEPAVFANFEAVLKCLATRLRPPQLLAHARELVLGNRAAHFVLLLLEPALSLEGVYALEKSLERIQKVWGDTPDEIEAEEGVRFWMYNGVTDGFVEQEERGFSPLTDAISM